MQAIAADFEPPLEQVELRAFPGAVYAFNHNERTRVCARGLQKLIAELDPQLPVSDVLTMQQIIERSLGNASLSASLVFGFAVLSLMLASVGLYGVLSYLMTQRTGEIGIRMALGARREQVVRLMLGDGLRPVLYGLVLGLVVSAGTVRLIQSMLYGTRPLDPAVFAAVAATLLATADDGCGLCDGQRAHDGLQPSRKEVR